MTTTVNRTDMLERRANIVRSRLLRAVDALDARRHQIERVGAHAKKVAAPATLGAVAVVALLGASAYAFSVAIKRRRRLTLGERVASAVREIERAARPSFFRRALESAALATISLVATEAARRALGNAADGRLLDGRLAVGRALQAHHEELATT